MEEEIKVTEGEVIEETVVQPQEVVAEPQPEAPAPAEVALDSFPTDPADDENTCISCQ